MGRFINPDNSAFQVALNSEIYVDKTKLLEYTNKVLDTKQAMICNSRPRRFGKSVTADMLAAYYSSGCDSEQMFQNLAISEDDAFKKHLNKYEVPDAVETAYGAMSCINAALGKKFIVIVDEWDVLIRDEAANHAVQEEYINFLRGMFKGSEPIKYLHLAYNQANQTVSIPNEEIRQEFIAAMKSTQALEGYTGDILLVGINYDKKEKNMYVLSKKLKKYRTEIYKEPMEKR